MTAFLILASQDYAHSLKKLTKKLIIQLVEFSFQDTTATLWHQRKEIANPVFVILMVRLNLKKVNQIVIS